MDIAGLVWHGVRQLETCRVWDDVPVASAHIRAKRAPMIYCACSSSVLMTVTTSIVLSLHGFLSSREPSFSLPYKKTTLGTACAAAFLHCLETNAQTAVAWRLRRKLRTEMRSSRGSTPAGNAFVVRGAPGREQ